MTAKKTATKKRPAAKKKAAPRRPKLAAVPKAKVLATLTEEELRGYNARIATQAMQEDRAAAESRVAAMMQDSLTLYAQSIKEAHDLPPRFNIDRATGEVTEIVQVEETVTPEGSTVNA